MTTQSEKLVEVFSYTPERLAEVLCNGHLAISDLITEKYRHFNFLVDYFDPAKDGHPAKTMVIEKKYLSKSYIQDYSNFYSTCYVNYERFCKRIHFFTAEFKEEELLKLVLDSANKENPVWHTYLGYVVIRPLSNAIIGATLLKPYAEENTGRFYNAIREYDINFLGKELKLKTLVFQEQDSVVGACASSALWSALHKTCMPDVFQTPLLSPSEITKSVKSPFNEFTGRIFPNDSLTLQQVLESINSIGLVSELYTSEKLKRLEILKGIVYAYNKMGLPVLLLMKFEDGEHHLVTIAGYRLNEIELDSKNEDDISLQSDQVIKLYAHDDQVGPFSRIQFNTENENYKLKTAWINYDEDASAEELLKQIGSPSKSLSVKSASPEAIIIPLSDMIRIPYHAVYENIMELNSLFSLFLKASDKLIWDVYIEHSNKYKKELFDEVSTPVRIREKVLLRSLPKYIWLAKASIGGLLALEIVFDATNVANAHFWKHINIYNDDLRSQLKKAMDNEESGIKEIILQNLGKKYGELIEQETK